MIRFLLTILFVSLLTVPALAEEMKKLVYTKTHHLSKLHDELQAAFPEWRTLGSDGRFRTSVSVSGDGRVVTLWVPVITDETVVQAVINSHDPTPPAPSMSDKDKLRNAIDGATSLAELKEVLKDNADMLVK